jgi:competence protein ComEA
MPLLPRPSSAAIRAALGRRAPSRRGLLNLALAVAALLAFALLIAREPASLGVEVERRDPPRGIDEIRVHISGAVLRPGVVTVEPGERVIEALERAGGAASDADLAAVNLARRLADEDHIHVPLLGESSPLIDLNSATQRELESLPGIGPVRAAGIIEARAEAPFLTSDELVERGIVPASVYEGLRDLVATPQERTVEDSR